MPKKEQPSRIASRRTAPLRPRPKSTTSRPRVASYVAPPRVRPLQRSRLQRVLDQLVLISASYFVVALTVALALAGFQTGAGGYTRAVPASGTDSVTQTVTVPTTRASSAEALSFLVLPSAFRDGELFVPRATALQIVGAAKAGKEKVTAVLVDWETGAVRSSVDTTCLSDGSFTVTLPKLTAAVGSRAILLVHVIDATGHEVVGAQTLRIE